MISGLFQNRTQCLLFLSLLDVIPHPCMNSISSWVNHSVANTFVNARQSFHEEWRSAQNYIALKLHMGFKTKLLEIRARVVCHIQSATGHVRSLTACHLDAGIIGWKDRFWFQVHMICHNIFDRLIEFSSTEALWCKREIGILSYHLFKVFTYLHRFEVVTLENPSEVLLSISLKNSDGSGIFGRMISLTLQKDWYNNKFISVLSRNRKYCKFTMKDSEAPLILTKLLIMWP